MTGWISARRADAFESQLSSPSTGATPDRALLALVGELRAVESPAPRPEFLADLRSRLMAEAADVLTAPAPGLEATRDRLTLPQRDPRRQRRVVAAVGSIVLIGTGSTMAMASQSALPGDGLYPIKRLVENARSSVTFSDTARGQQELDHARARLQEALALVEKGDAASVSQVPDVLDTFVRQAREGADILLADYARHEDAASVEAVRSFAAQSLDRLRTMQSQAPAGSAEALREAALAMVHLDSSASALCPACRGGLGDYSALVAAPAPPGLVVPDLSPTTPDPSVPSNPALPTIDPAAVASALDNVPTPQPPTPRPSDTTTRGSTDNGGDDPATTPSKKPTPTTPPRSTAPSKDPVTGLTDTLLGDGTSGDDATTGVVPGVVGGVAGVVGGVVGGLLGTLAGKTPAP